MAPPQSSEWPVGRRIKAAMRLAGIDSFEELSARISERNYGSRTLRKYADDNDTEYVPTRGQLLVIAEACDLPYEFFTLAREDLVRALKGAGEEGRKPRAELEQRLATIEAALKRVLEVVPIPEPPVGLLPPHEAESPTRQATPLPGTAAADSRRGSGR